MIWATSGVAFAAVVMIVLAVVTVSDVAVVTVQTDEVVIIEVVVEVENVWQFPTRVP